MSKRSSYDQKPPSLPLRLLACDDLGLLKGIEAPSLANLGDAHIVSTWGEPNRERKSAGCIAVSSSSLEAQGQVYAAVGRCDGSITVYDALEGSIVFEMESDPCKSNEAEDRALVSLGWLPEQQGDSSQQKLLACTRGGVVTIHNSSQAEGEAVTWSSGASWAVPKPVHCMAISEDGTKAAFGCEGAELSIWDIATQQQSYLAKGAKPNRVGLVDHASNTAVTFIPGSEATKVLAGTAKHTLRLYDVKHGRRPVLDISFGEARITALAPAADGVTPACPSVFLLTPHLMIGNRIWVATAAGQIEVLDLKAGKMSEALKGSTGSVRALAPHLDLPLIASAGLDRYLRLHDTSTRKQVAGVYLKQHLTGVTFCPAKPVAQSQGEDEAATEMAEEEKPAKVHKKRRKSKKLG